MNNPSIYGWIKEQVNSFETYEVTVGENWLWNLRRHVQLIFHLKNGVFYTGENNWLRAFKLIMRPLLRLSYWMEDLEVKDVVFYIENTKGRVLSFLIKKYHDEVYVKKHNLDTLFDEITESDIDYGGALVQKTSDGAPEVIPLNSLAFCDQTDMMGGPRAFRYYLSPDKLRQMSKYGWGSESNGATIDIEGLILLAREEKLTSGVTNAKSNNVSGRAIEIYIVHGNLPEHYLEDNDNVEDFYNQIHIVGFYEDKNGERQGVTLYRKKEEEGNMMFHVSEKIHGRALGFSDGESFLHPQIWSNFLEIHKMQMLESGAKTPLVTDDQAFSNKNRIQDMENLEIATVEEGKTINFIPTINPNNIQLYSNSIDTWFSHAQLLGSAFDPVLGIEAASGTTFRGQERVVSQGRGWHDRRKGQRAKFIEEIYRNWIIPDIVKEINSGKEFLASLTGEEMSWVADQLAENVADERIIEMVVKEGKRVSQEDKETLKQLVKEGFAKKGNRHLVKILKGEFKDVEVKIGINVANKQKDLAVLSDKILSIFQFVFSNPQGFQQAMQNPALSRAFSDILEYSGLSMGQFTGLIQPPQNAPQGAPQNAQQTPSPLQINQQQTV